MICEKYFELIEDLLAGELDEHLSEKAESHIFACQACRERYEMLRRAKEIYGRYLFDAEPPPDSWANFQARLVSENEKARSDNFIAPVNIFRRIKRSFVFNLSPASTAAAALAILLFAGGIGFVWLQFKSVETDGGKFVSKMETENSPSREIDQKPPTNLPEKTIGANDNLPKNNDFLAESQSLKARNNSLSGKKPFAAAETVKINQKTAFPGVKRKSAGKSRPNEEKPLPALQAQKLEIEIAGQIEKVELLLRSFRNALSNGTIDGFDVEYEKRQARKLLDKNARLKRSAENYGLSYAEELLSHVETYLLEIANLETNPSTESVRDIKERVSSQNIIASLQAYSRDAVQ